MRKSSRGEKDSLSSEASGCSDASPALREEKDAKEGPDSAQDSSATLSSPSGPKPGKTSEKPEETVICSKRAQKNSPREHHKKCCYFKREGIYTTELSSKEEEGSAENRSALFPEKAASTEKPSFSEQSSLYVKNTTSSSHSGSSSPPPSSASAPSHPQSPYAAATTPQIWSYGNKKPAFVPRKKLYAALDLGTNNCRLLVAYPQAPGYFRVVDSFSQVVRLGEGILETGFLAESAIARTIEALKICRRKIDSHPNVVRTRLIATQACRVARNQEDFVQRAATESGVTLEVLTQEKEAHLAVVGCASLLKKEAEGVLVFDVGGGSSELIWLDLRNRHRERGIALTRFIRGWASIPIGVVTLTERYKEIPQTPALFEEMVAYVTTQIPHLSDEEALQRQLHTGDVYMLGTSCTATTLVSMHMGLTTYDRRKVDGAWAAMADIGALITMVSKMTAQELAAHPCIGKSRSDFIFSGCAILEAFRRRWPCAFLQVADRGLREGMLVDMMTRDRVWS